MPLAKFELCEYVSLIGVWLYCVIEWWVCPCRRERHAIPLIVQTCVDEVEKRGLSEVGIYRVAGVLRDVQELRASFDTGW